MSYSGKWKGNLVNGFKVIIHTEDGPDKNRPIVGSYKDNTGTWGVTTWSKDGNWLSTPGPLALVPNELWVKGCDLKPGMYVDTLNYNNKKIDLRCHSLVVAVDRGTGELKMNRITKEGTLTNIDSNNPYRVV